MGDNWGAAGVGQQSVTVGGSARTLATVQLPSNTDVSTAAHEIGHGYGYEHSRSLASSTVDYFDCFDIMSFNTCVAGRSTFTPASGSSFSVTGAGEAFGDPGVYAGNVGEEGYAKGPGLDAIDLDDQGWIPAARHVTWSPGQGQHETVSLIALGDESALGAPATDYLEGRIPAAVTIQNAGTRTDPPTCSGSGDACTTSRYYTVELRDAEGFDLGIHHPVVLLHLFGQDGRSYWVNSAGDGSGDLNAQAGLGASEFADPAHGVYLAVNDYDAAEHTAQVTEAGSPIPTSLSALTAAPGPPGFETITGRLTVSSAGAVSAAVVPVQNAYLHVTLGGTGCTQLTSADGSFACQVPTSTLPGGTYALTVTFDRSTAYAAANASASVTLTKPPPPPVLTAISVGNQRITLATPAGTGCLTTPGTLIAGLAASVVKGSRAARLSFGSAAFYLGRGVKHVATRTVRHPHHRTRRIRVTTWLANVTVHHVPATARLKLARQKPGTQTLNVVVRLTETVTVHHRRVRRTVTRTLRARIKLC